MRMGLVGQAPCAHPAEPIEQSAHRSRAREAGAQEPEQERERDRGDEDDQDGVANLQHLVGTEGQREHGGSAHGSEAGTDPDHGCERPALHRPE